ncbi:MAG: hypothetical protein HQ491_00210 [Bacteroidetes bacterium]|nr:hypothetical protein [Bacteroidota bacterium]
MKKQLLLVTALLFTASAYSQISTNHDTRVRTATRTGIESDRPNTVLLLPMVLRHLQKPGEGKLIV